MCQLASLKVTAEWTLEVFIKDVSVCRHIHLSTYLHSPSQAIS